MIYAEFENDLLNCDSFLLCAIGGGIFDLLEIHKKQNQQQHFTILVEAIRLANLTNTLEKGNKIIARFSGALNIISFLLVVTRTI